MEREWGTRPCWAWLLLALLLAPFADATFVQEQYCQDPGRSTYDSMSSTRVSLDPIDGRSGGRNLSWTIRYYMGTEECEALLPNATVDFTFDTLGFSTKYRAFGNATCKDVSAWSPDFPAAFIVSVSKEIDHLYRLSTFHSAITVLAGNSSKKVGCRQVDVTAAIEPALSRVFQWAPAAIFLFVLLAETLRTVRDAAPPVTLTPSPPPGGGGNDDDDANGQGAEETQRRPVLHNVADCFNYLQFVFFTASLTLFYPGFYMPVASHLSWASLFYTFRTGSDFSYQSVKDGVYEMNGTYGGTYGLELMHQIAGAPRASTTWLNMVLGVGVVVVASALLKLGLRVVRRLHVRRRRRQGFPGREEGPRREGVAGWGVWILRVVVSYFIMPLAAISFYQFDNAHYQPLYHTVLAAVVVGLVLMLFAWALYQIPIRSLGQLLFDRSNRYQRLETEEDDGWQVKQDTIFIWILFIVSFSRGAIVGGLQMSPVAQITLLATCEVVLLISIFSFRAYPLWSINTGSAIIRLVSVLLMVAFIPEIVKRDIKSLIGYIVLLLHACVLLGYVWSASVSLWQLLSERIKAPKPDVYGLRELTRRERSPIDPSLSVPSPQVGVDAVSRDSSLSSRYYGDVDRTRTGLRMSVDTERLASPDIYFRHPRPSSFVRNQSRTSQVSGMSRSGEHRYPLSAASSVSSRVPSGSSKKSSARSNVRSKDVEQQADSGSCPSLTANSLAGESLTSSGVHDQSKDSSETHYERRPLGPRWNDYSFRESDLFYTAPRPEGQPTWNSKPNIAAPASEPQPDTNTRPQQSWMRSTMSGVLTKLVPQRNEIPPAERGFQVSRPGNPLGLRPPSGATSSSSSERGFQVSRPGNPLGLQPPSGATSPLTPTADQQLDE